MLTSLLPALAAISTFGLLVFAMLIAGRLLEAAGWARPLAGGDLRARLEALAGRAGVVVSGILVGAGAGLNGRVLGLTRGSRRVMLTEGLLDRFGPAEVEAVFAHEVGHIRLGHFRWILALIGAFLLLAHPIETAAQALPAWFGWPMAFVFFFAAWLFTFGRVCRRFELEADLAAADLVGAGPCQAALARGEEAGIARGSIFHPPFDRRRNHLDACAAGGPERAAFDRGGRWLRLALVLFLVAAAAAFAAALALVPAR